MTRRALLASQALRVIRLQTGASFRIPEVGHFEDFGCSKWPVENYLSIRFVSSIFFPQDTII